MNIHIKSYLLGLAFCGVALTSCESFDSINLNPNDPTPETVDPTFLLTPTMIKGTLDVDMYQRIHNLYVDNFAQYFANDKYASNNCVPVESWTQDFWNMHWQWIDALNEIIKNYSDDPKLVNTVQIARIWKVWLFHRATDLWGGYPLF
ncbi:SusD/RagB family nutrient-binding outer membrane lipoprotein [Parabacteroides goldsteinii]|uniref:SusD/RagB family nutrient-binding outer membrane lipoprotein n=1 Tax=Parabacteroides goldsteinii TaxID=328812 RepID=UPI0025AF4A34|nr:SusD/RagB family nutrient-binding outer membrane lipoprotein [Parabacteroides goldsteinii]